MSIFISHTTAEDRKAQSIANIFSSHGINYCYIDGSDLELKRRKSALTPYYIDKIKESDTILAIVSKKAQNLGWAFFEICLAR